ncbi:hypothetical protein EW146_g8547 [Bondarzewia mesenterica]|uniref:DUF7729 domain-containing protein n=1 Tax=Bondarzewia mesenterica TaxID=1095465 RepID=A0A4S4LF96_9AGAM|nr:hypothetical protein EW146_g8547 [Bondarzewia mesenterica]
MFTPPASPLPPSHPTGSLDTPSLMSTSTSAPPTSPPSSPSPVRPPHAQTAVLEAQQDPHHLHKQRIAQRTRLTMILVPLILILITVSTRYTAHPKVLDLFSDPSLDSYPHWSDLTDWDPHPAHPRRQDTSSIFTVASSITFPSSLSLKPTATVSSASGTQSASTGLPTIPTATPVLPTPFPQPFDSTMNQQYSTVGCLQFITNMTNTDPFRQCRPFSLLMRTSSAFIQVRVSLPVLGASRMLALILPSLRSKQAQTNATALNIDIWGTCNTPIDADQCAANMAWFASELTTQCQKDLSDQNKNVMQALTGLQTYTLLRQAACLADQSTSAYCYLEAATASQPSDLYFYSLPWGIALPNGTAFTCSACTKSVMALFATHTSNVTGLSETYANAASIAQNACGTGFCAVVGMVNRSWDDGLVLGPVVILLSALRLSSLAPPLSCSPSPFVFLLK